MRLRYPLPYVRQAITFAERKLSLRADVPVLRDVSFTIPAGQICAIVGASGAGKSTLADLLLRFYDPDAGTISIDGQDIRQLRLEDLRRQVAIVEQTPYLFPRQRPGEHRIRAAAGRRWMKFGYVRRPRRSIPSSNRCPRVTRRSSANGELPSLSESGRESHWHAPYCAILQC